MPHQRNARATSESVCRTSSVFPRFIFLPLFFCLPRVLVRTREEWRQKNRGRKIRGLALSVCRTRILKLHYRYNCDRIPPTVGAGSVDFRSLTEAAFASMCESGGNKCSNRGRKITIRNIGRYHNT